ncbi:hypothetical protein Tco_1556093 [Tanacetum coccineum]
MHDEDKETENVGLVLKLKLISTDDQMERNDDQVDASEEIFEGTEDQRESTEEQTKEEIATQASQTSTQTPSSMIFGDDETIATLLINMSKVKTASKEKEKGVELKDVEDTDRPRPTSTKSTLTLKPLPKIDPKDKGKKKIEEEDETERKVQEEWEAEEERNKIAEEQATNEALIQDFDDIKARIEADRILAEKLQEQEREQFTIEERAKFLHDTIAAQRKFLAQQRFTSIKEEHPTTKSTQKSMIKPYLKHVGKFKHANLKGSEVLKNTSYDDEKRDGLSKSDVIKLMKEVDYEVLDKKYPIIDWKTQNYGTKPQLDEAKTNKEINLNVVTRSNGQKRHFSVLTSVICTYLIERSKMLDFINVRIIYQKIRCLKVLNDFFWGDLMVLFNPDEQDEFWNSQHEWKIISWKLHSSSGVHTLMTNEGVVIHMLTEKSIL